MNRIASVSLLFILSLLSITLNGASAAFNSNFISRKGLFASRSTSNGSTATTNSELGMVTGYKGKAASSKEEDLEKTVRLILQHDNQINAYSSSKKEKTVASVGDVVETERESRLRLKLRKIKNKVFSKK